jgi:hypothetical protein
MKNSEGFHYPSLEGGGRFLGFIRFPYPLYPFNSRKMTIDIEITKTDIETIRKRMGLKTKTRADVVLQSLIKTVVDDEYSLTYNQW